MTLAQRISAMVAPMPDAGMVTLPVSTLREWLAGEPNAVPDLTLDQLRADHFPKVSTSALREWCAKSLFPHAYKRLGRVWLVPVCCVQEFKEGQRSAPGVLPTGLTIVPPMSVPQKRSRRASPNRTPHVRPDTSAWRNVK